MRIGQRDNAASAPQTGDGIQPGRNSLTFHEDRKTRKFEASLTDTAMQALGGVFGDLFAQRGVVRIPQPYQNGGAKLTLEGTRTLPAEAATQHAANGASSGASSEAVSEPAESGTPAPTATLPNSPDREGLLQLFTPNGDKLELADNRLKATTQADYVRRLTYLFLYAHESLGRPSVPEADLNNMLQTAKVMDANGNTRTWLRKRNGIATEGENGVKLTRVGREGAQTALKAALDAGVPDTWNPDRSVKAKPSKSKKKE